MNMRKAREQEERKLASQARRAAGIRQVERVAVSEAPSIDPAAPHIEERDGVKIWVRTMIGPLGQPIRLALPHISMQHDAALQEKGE